MAKSIEALKAQHAAQLAAAIAENEFESKLPEGAQFVTPMHAGLGYGSAHYKTAGLFEAVKLLASFPVLVPFSALRNGCLRYSPAECLGAKLEQWEVTHENQFGCSIKSERILNSPSAGGISLRFFTRVDGVIVSIEIDVKGTGYIGSYGQLAPVPVNVKEWRGTAKAEGWKPSPLFSNGCTKTTKWGSGDAQNSASYEHVYSADYYDERPAKEYEHMIGHLVHLARAAGEEVPNEWEYNL